MVSIVNTKTGKRAKAKLATDGKTYKGTLVSLAKEYIPNENWQMSGMSFAQIRPEKGGDVLIPGDWRMIEEIFEDLEGQQVEARPMKDGWGWTIFSVEGQ